MTDRPRTLRRAALAAGALAAMTLGLAFAWPSANPAAPPQVGIRTAAVSAPPTRAGAAARVVPHPPLMPPIDDRIATIVGARGIPPEARGRLVALGSDLAALRARETAAVGADEATREDLTAERRVVTAKARTVLEALPPAYRAAMRRARVSPRQLAVWAIAHPER